MNENGKSREGIVYSARHHSRTDLQSHLDVPVMEFLETAHWATNRQIQIGVRGYYEKRWSTLEDWLRSKSRRGYLRWTWYDHKTKAYAKKRKTKGFDPEDPDHVARLVHGVAVTECLIRFITAKEGEALPERCFRSYGRVAEFGVLFENGKLVLVEYSTKHDYQHTGKVRGKLIGYDECLERIEEDFDAKATVIYILDIPKETIKKRIIEKYKPSGKFFFVSFSDFKSVPMGQALIAPIYLWKDGKEYPLIR